MRPVMAAHGIAALSMALLLLGCAEPGPARERGFFGGLGAMISGQDQSHAQRLEGQATAEERRALEQRQRLGRAQAGQRQSAEELRAAEARLAALDGQLERQRAELARLRAERGAAGAAEGDRLAREAEAIRRARDSAGTRPGGPTAADAADLEQRARALEEAIRRYGAI
jgi:chromosome segregation ATPase